MNETLEILYQEYLKADKRNKPGLALAIDTLGGFPYVQSREALTAVVNNALIQSADILITADRADYIAGDIIDHVRNL